ncbi:hypothetical protein [Flavobacterium sp.]|jgi:hypothetical protein|uniref:hypothetical protein n=1 Tax=Flavobacterium sp. TaxID=239 RepID=UPI0037BEA8C0
MIFSITSCSNDNIVSNEKSIDKTNAMEFKNTLFVAQSDGSILKYENNKKKYSIDLKTKINVSSVTNKKNKTTVYRISNPTSGEFIDFVDFVEEGDYLKFTAVTSAGEQITDIKYYGDDLISNLESHTFSNNQPLKCPPCWRAAAVVVVTVIESMQDTTMEQCRGSMPKTCPTGKAPFMEFSEGWFSTTCNVGCR